MPVFMSSPSKLQTPLLSKSGSPSHFQVSMPSKSGSPSHFQAPMLSTKKSSKEQDLYCDQAKTSNLNLLGTPLYKYMTSQSPLFFLKNGGQEESNLVDEFSPKLLWKISPSSSRLTPNNETTLSSAAHETKEAFSSDATGIVFSQSQSQIDLAQAQAKWEQETKNLVLNSHGIPIDVQRHFWDFEALAWAPVGMAAWSCVASLCLQDSAVSSYVFSENEVLQPLSLFLSSFVFSGVSASIQYARNRVSLLKSDFSGNAQRHFAMQRGFPGMVSTLTGLAYSLVGSYAIPLEEHHIAQSLQTWGLMAILVPSYYAGILLWEVKYKKDFSPIRKFDSCAA
jgi:hypothetical protein